MTENFCKQILLSYKIHNADVILRDNITVDEFIDVIEGNRQYIRCLFVYNKIDTITLEHLDKISQTKDGVVISCSWKVIFFVKIVKFGLFT
jgi:uncharacterized protein